MGRTKKSAYRANTARTTACRTGHSIKTPGEASAQKTCAQKKGSVSRETDPSIVQRLTLGPRRQNIHDPVEVFDARKLDADAALTRS